MAGCFPNIHLHSIKLKRRTRSLELEDIATEKTPPDSPHCGSPQIPTRKTHTKKQSSLFRSRSEEGLKAAKTTPPRRRWTRVVHDDQHWGEEYESPYVVRHYSKNYWEKQQEEARKTVSTTSLNYTVNSEHTILKKSLSKSVSTESDTDIASSSQTMADKHPCFSNKVQVIEFVDKEKITKHLHHMHATRLVDSDDEVIYEEEPVKNVKKLMRQESKDEFKIAKELVESVRDSEEEKDQESITKCPDDTSHHVKQPKSSQCPLEVDKELECPPKDNVNPQCPPLGTNEGHNGNKLNVKDNIEQSECPSLTNQTS